MAETVMKAASLARSTPRFHRVRVAGAQCYVLLVCRLAAISLERSAGKEKAVKRPFSRVSVIGAAAPFLNRNSARNSAGNGQSSGNRAGALTGQTEIFFGAGSYRMSSAVGGTRTPRSFLGRR